MNSKSRAEFSDFGMRISSVLVNGVELTYLAATYWRQQILCTSRGDWRKFADKEEKFRRKFLAPNAGSQEDFVIIVEKFKISVQ